MSVAGVVVGAALVLTSSSGADGGLRATDVLSVLSAAPVARAPDEVTQVGAFGVADFSETRVLGCRLGRFDSTLLVAPGRGGRSICYVLNPRSQFRGVGTGYCHPLGDIPETAKNHYSVLTPETWAGSGYDTQVIGIVFDDVVAVRVRVNDEWRAVPIIRNNGLYLDLDGRYEQLQPNRGHS